MTSRSFCSEHKGQAAAFDILLFALLISAATWIIASHPFQREDVTMEELRGRYAMDLAHSFALPARYVSDSESPGITYSIGPNGKCSVGTDGVLYRLSDIINSSLGASPLERNLGGSALDLIADDLFLSISFHGEGIQNSLSNYLLTGCFHERLDSALKSKLVFLWGDAFDFRIEASWHPYEGTELDALVYSNVSYGSDIVPADSPIYVSSFPIAIPLDEEALTNLHTSLGGFLGAYVEIKGLLSNIDGGKFETISADATKKNTSDFSVNERAYVKVMMWPKNAV